jgi:hypothetical protein
VGAALLIDGVPVGSRSSPASALLRKSRREMLGLSLSVDDPLRTSDHAASCMVQSIQPEPVGVKACQSRASRPDLKECALSTAVTGGSMINRCNSPADLVRRQA